MEVAAHQYKIKQQKRIAQNNWVPPISTESAVCVREMPLNEAKAFIIEYEWLGNIGSNRYQFGLYIDKYLAGVVCYSNTVSNGTLAKKLGISSNEVVYLSRGANTYWAPKWVPSKLISRSIKILYKSYGIKAIIAYSDPQAGEIGTVYQAANFVFWWQTNPGGAKMYRINSELLHPRTVYRRYGTRRREALMMIDNNFTTVDIQPKLRYVYLTGKLRSRLKLLNRIKDEVKKYPKRNPTCPYYNIGQVVSW